MKKIADFLVYFIVSNLCRLISLFPPKLGMATCLAIIRTLFFLMHRSKKVAIRNIQACLPELKNPEKIYYDSAKILAENLYTFCLLPKVDKEFIDKNIDYSEFLETIKACEKKSSSILILTAHFGLFELGGYMCSLLGHPLKILTRDLKLPKVEKWWNGIREKHGSEVYSRKGAYRKTIQYLKENKTTSMLCDQNTKRNNAVFVDFFNIKAATTVTIGHAVAKTKCALMFIVLVKEKNKKYKLIARTIDTDFSTDDIKEFSKQTMKNYHSVLEEVIRKYPDHWFWIHRRFKTRPEGEKEDFYN